MIQGRGKVEGYAWNNQVLCAGPQTTDIQSQGEWLLVNLCCEQKLGVGHHITYSSSLFNMNVYIIIWSKYLNLVILWSFVVVQYQWTFFYKSILRCLFCMYMLCVYIHVWASTCMLQNIYSGQKTAYRTQFFPFTIWV